MSNKQPNIFEEDCRDVVSDIAHDSFDSCEEEETNKSILDGRGSEFNSQLLVSCAIDHAIVEHPLHNCVLHNLATYSPMIMSTKTLCYSLAYGVGWYVVRLQEGLGLKPLTLF